MLREYNFIRAERWYRTRTKHRSGTRQCSTTFHGHIQSESVPLTSSSKLLTAMTLTQTQVCSPNHTCSQRSNSSSAGSREDPPSSTRSTCMLWLAAGMQTDPPSTTNQENATRQAAASLRSALKGVCTRKVGKKLVGYLHIVVSLAVGSSGLQDSCQSAPCRRSWGHTALRNPRGPSPPFTLGFPINNCMKIHCRNSRATRIFRGTSPPLATSPGARWKGESLQAIQG